MFYFGTINQFHALRNIQKKFPITSLIYHHGNDVNLPNEKSIKYPFWLTYFIAIFCRIFYLKKINKLSLKFKSKNKYISYHYNISILLGSYYLGIILLKFCRPKYLWLSNDHSTVNNAFLYAAKKLKIKTIYIQHASVSNLFPPLNFDYAFLDGQIAYQTYKRIGIRGAKVTLSGISKMDGYIGKYTPGKKISNILICLNQLDDINIFEGLINHLLRMKYSIKVRKHPYMNRGLNNENKLEISSEKVFMDSLNNMDILIAGDSNVHLEATLANIPCFYLSTSEYFDYYGFLQNGLLVWGGKNIEECLTQVQDYQLGEDVYLRAKPYCASIGTEYQNKSTTFILNQLSIYDNDDNKLY